MDMDAEIEEIGEGEQYAGTRQHGPDRIEKEEQRCDPAPHPVGEEIARRQHGKCHGHVIAEHKIGGAQIL